MPQTIGVVLIVLGVWLLWSPWALVLGGALLLLAPEVGELARRRRRGPQ